MTSAPMYGTVMLGRSSVDVAQLRALVRTWAAQIGDAAGFVDERCLVSGDGRVVVCVRFRDRAAYEALADRPEQAAWWEAAMKPLFDGEPEWIDGAWHDI